MKQNLQGGLSSLFGEGIAELRGIIIMMVS
jgi:hypothetical protein